MARPAPPAEATAAPTLDALAVEEQGCRRCDLYRDATQAVPGRGARKSPLMLVGEQPGNSEDLAGEPFIGPAGRVLATSLEQAGIDPADTFTTNAVKHFKFEQRGKRRLHKSPAIREIDACGIWLQREIELVEPRVIVALGASAARALLRRRVVLKNERGQLGEFAGRQLLITVHPSWLLRLRDEDDRARERQRFVEDLQLALAAAGAA